MMFKQGDIVLIPVPFSDLTNRKQRPVLIISKDSYNELTEGIVVVAITSNLKNLDYSLVLEEEDLSEGSLKVTSAVRADKIYTLSKDIVRRKFGKVNSEFLDGVRLKVSELIKIELNIELVCIEQSFFYCQIQIVGSHREQL